MKKTLVTGGAGYIGGVKVERMVAQGLARVVLDKFSEGHHDAVPPGVPIVEAYLADAPALRRAFSPYEIQSVVHLGAQIEVAESVRDPARFYRQNVAGLLHLLDAVLEFGVKKMVFSSSAAAYGLPDQVPIREESSASPLNPCGWTNSSASRFCGITRKRMGWPPFPFATSTSPGLPQNVASITAGKVIWCGVSCKWRSASARKSKSMGKKIPCAEHPRRPGEPRRWWPALKRLPGNSAGGRTKAAWKT